jgi:hypothetical protein
MTDVRDPMTEVIRRPTAIMPSRYSLFTLSKISKRPRAEGSTANLCASPDHRLNDASRRSSRAAPAALARRDRRTVQKEAPLPAPRDTNDAAHRSVATIRFRALRGGGGGERNRTDDLLLAKQALSQLSYTPDATRVASSGQRLRRNRESRAAQNKHQTPAPNAQSRSRGATAPLSRFDRTMLRIVRSVVGQGGFEPPTSRLSSARSNQLSY